MPRRRDGDWVALGRAIRDARLRGGHSNGKQFAAEAHVSQATLYALEGGRHVAEQTIIKVSDRLGWPPDRWREILHGDQPKDQTGDDELIVDVPPDEWVRLSPEDRRHVLDLVRRLAGK